MASTRFQRKVLPFCAPTTILSWICFSRLQATGWIYWIAEELFKNRSWTSCLKNWGFSVKRGTGDVSSIKTAFLLLDENKIIGIFPHGTRLDSRVKNSPCKARSRDDSCKYGCSVIPAAVCGSYGFAKMKVIYGEPFLVKPRDKKPTKQELAEISRKIINRVRSLAEVGS